ncbi:MAG: ATP synthase F1 subunit delta [Candidatus Omnitrophica bacterium]|nr:ATP synthase F1 subunit delta [Candidatus Omnitrophota bacterium]
MIDPRAGVRYARALFGLADERDQLDKIEKDLEETARLTARHPEIANLLGNTTISREEKEDFIGKILPSGSSSLLVNFIKVLVRKKRFRDLSLIQERFHRLYEEKKGLQKVRVESAVALTGALEEKLRRALEKKLDLKVTLENSINPALLGGLVLDFDGTRIDGSYRTALEGLKQTLLNPRK